MSFKKAALQTMSTDELLQLADHYGIFLSADLTRRLIIGELLDLEDEENNTEQETPANDDDNSIPVSYNMTQIGIVLKDPLWFFVFWDFHEQLFSTLTKSEDFLGFFLRVHSIDPENTTKTLDFFDIHIPETDRKRYVHVSFYECVHRIDLMAGFSDGKEQVLAKSTTIPMNRNIIPQRLCVSQNSANRIMTLSGLAALKKSHFRHYRQAF